MTVGTGFEVLDAQARPVAHNLFLMPSDPDIELSSMSLAPSILVAHHDDNELNLGTVKIASVKCFHL